jgi:hypothetical protein
VSSSTLIDGPNSSRPSSPIFLKQITWASASEFEQVEFGEELSDHFLVERVEAQIDYTLTSAAGTATVIRLSEANRDAIYDAFVNVVDFNSEPVGQIVDHLKLSQLIKLQRDLGMQPTGSLEPGLNVDLAGAASGVYTGNLRCAIPAWRLPHVQLRTAFCPFARQLRPGGLNLTSGTSDSSNTFTDGNSVTWYISAATIKIYAVGFESSDKGERSPIFYGKTESTITDNLNIAKRGLFLHYNVQNGGTNSTPLEFQQNAPTTSGIEVNADGYLALRRKGDTAYYCANAWESGRFGRGWPAAEAGYNGTSHLSMDRSRIETVPVLTTPEAARLNELVIVRKGLTITLESGFSGTCVHTYARVPSKLAGCVCDPTAPRVSLPGSPSGTPIPVQMIPVMPKSELAGKG